MLPEKLQQIFKQVFENKNLSIDASTSPNDISGWNSLKHVLLINEIEKAYEVQFSLDEMIEMENAGAIADCLKKKLKNNKIDI